MSIAGDEGRGALSRVLVPPFGGRRSSISAPDCSGRSVRPTHSAPPPCGGRRAGSPRHCCNARLFGLSPGGVYHAPNVSVRAVGSYPAFSPLPDLPCGSHRRSKSLWHFPSTSFEAVLPLATTLPCGARTFLNLTTSRSRPSAPRPSTPAFQRTLRKQTGCFLNVRTSFGIPAGPLDRLRASRPPASPASRGARPLPRPPTGPP